MTFNVDATLLAVVSPHEDSFTIGIWHIQNSPNETETQVGEKIFQSDQIHGPTPHYIRFNLTDPLSLHRRLMQDENEVIIWDHTLNAVEICSYDENIHLSLKPAFAEEKGWIVSTKTRRRLLWLPEDRRAEIKFVLPANTSRFAANGEVIAIASDARKFTVLDMYRLSSS